MYSYAQLGMCVFGGLIWEGQPALEGSEFGSNGYYLVNFNDFFASMVFLFQVGCRLSASIRSVCRAACRQRLTHLV